MNYNEKVAILIKDTRKNLNLKSEHIADELKISKSSLSLIENGKQEITVNKLYEIAEKMNVPITTFIPEAKSNTQISHGEYSPNNIINGTQINNADPNIVKLLHSIIENSNSVLEQLKSSAK